MTNRDIAMKFLKFFCAGDVSALAPLLAEDLKFKGPFCQFDSSEAYLDCLRIDPPEKCSFRVLSVTENEGSVGIFYEYRKKDRTMTIAQLFDFKSQKIVEMLLVFDGREFA